MALDGSIIRDSAQKLGQMLKKELPQEGDALERGLADDPIAPKRFQDVLHLAQNIGTKTSEYEKLEFEPVKSPLPLTGGHNPIQAMQDQFKRFWLFKSIFDKGVHYKAVGDKVGADLAKAVGLPSPVVHFASEEINGKVQFGTVMPMIKHTGKRLSPNPKAWTESQKDQLTASHVFRWLIGDHDGKAANFLVLKDGNLVPIDFGNMYRNLGKDKLERHYQPNPTPQVYNKLWESYVKGDVDINFHAGLYQVSRIEQLSDQEFLKILEPYAEARYGRGGFVPKVAPTKEAFLKLALQRKQNIRTDISRFYDSLAKERGLTGLREALGQGNPWGAAEFAPIKAQGRV